jgi:branched-chain amino acid transport system permease protein
MKSLMKKASIVDLVWQGLVLVGMLFLPLLIPEDWVHLVVQILIMALFAYGVNLLLGYTGLIPFGEAAFFGLGSYTCALIILKTSLPFSAAIVASPVVAALVGVGIGWFCVRRSDIFFAMLTLAFGEMIFTIIFKWYGFTGGDDGLVEIPIPLWLASINQFYYFVVAIFVSFLIVMWLIVNSPFGKTLQAIRENPERVEFIGVNVKKYKLIAFTIAAFFSGLSGALFCCFNHNVFPAYAGWAKGAEPILMCVIGGMYNFLGPLVGAVIMITLEKVIISYTEYWPIFVGTILLLFVLFFRGGAVAFFQSILQRKGQWG